MAALDMTSFASALKVHYTPQSVQNMVYRDHPFLAAVAKYEKFGGKNLPIPIKYGNPNGRSATFATAKANKVASKYKDFTLTRKKDYALASIDNETIEASQGDANAFMEAATSEIDGALDEISKSLGGALFRNGSGSIGQISNSSFAGTTVTLVEPTDIVHFEVGMQIVANNTDDDTSVKSGTIEIEAVDRDAGTFEVAEASIATGIATIAQNDYLFVEGDPDQKVSGLAAWLPYTAPTAGDSFYGVDRSADVTRLAGIRKDLSALPIEEGLISLASRIAREGGKPDICWLNHDKYSDLELALGSKVQYVDLKVTAEIGFRGILINGPKGPIKVMPDHNCPKKYTYMLTSNTWKLYSLGKAPKILDADGLKMLRESDADAVEVRCGYYANLGCNAPGFNGVGLLE
jgi:hypothetical protein